MSAECDVSKLIAGLGTATPRVVAAAVEAVEYISEQAIGDAQQLCPVDTGTLAGGGTVGASAADVAAHEPVKIEGTMISREIGFNTNYAAAVHENLTAHHTQGQAKFLEDAIRDLAPRANVFIQGKIRKAL